MLRQRTPCELWRMASLSKAEKRVILREFGNHVEDLITKKFKNKEAFLTESGFYRKTLHDILTGAKDPWVTTLYKLANAIGVSPRELFPKKNA